MGKGLRLGWILVIIAGLGSLATAQRAIPRNIDSIDLTAVRSKSIVIGKITKVEDSPDTSGGLYSSITISVEQTLKGAKTNPILVRLVYPASHYRPFLEKSSRLLIAFPDKDEYSRSTIINLDDQPFLESRSDFSVIRDAESLIREIKELIAHNPEAVDARLESIYPVDTPIENAWKKAYGDSFIQLTVPIDQALEKIAWLRMNSNNPNQQSEAARYLGYFKTPENIAKVKELLKSPNSSVSPGTEESFGIDERNYYTRIVASKILYEWDIKIPNIVLHEFESSLSELKVLRFYKPISTESLKKLKNAKKLEELEFGGYALSTQQMALVGQLTSVTKLNLMRLKTNDEGIAQLTSLPNLQSLNLSGLAVTDRCLESIANMKSLTYVNLEMTWVTTHGLASLRKTRPDINVYPLKPISSLLLDVVNNDIFAVRQTLDREPWAINDRYVSNKGMTALHEAVELNRFDIAKLLLDRGAKTEVVDDAGATPLEFELSFYNPQDNMIRLLLGHGANLEHKRKNGKSIVSGIQNDWFDNHFFGTRMLLQCGADPTEMLAAFNANRTTTFAGGNGIKLIRDAVQYSKNPTQIVPNSNARCSRSAYKLDFVNLSQWTTQSTRGFNGPIRTSETPLGRQYLGPFAQQSVTLTTENLRKHKNVHVSIEVFIIGSWDGNAALGAGPDILDIQVPNVGTLLHSSFFNNTESDDAQLKLQSFPDPYMKGFHVGYTGASSAKSLGFTDVWDGITNHRDAVYKLEYSFAHSGPVVQLTFNGLTVSEGNITTLTGDENWGIGNLVITTD